MSEVKWIKITTDIFDDEKILLIESLPESDSIIVIWFKLLCLAGKQNNSGVFMLNDTMPYTDKMLATIFRRPETTVKLALETFEKFGMLEIIDGVITIPNWGKHQDLDKIEQKNSYMRDYMREYRDRQKELAERKTNGKANGKTNSKINVKTNGKIDSKESKTNGKANVSSLDKDKEREKDNTPLNPPTGESAKTACGMVEERHYPPRVEEKVREWLSYKAEKRQGYKETGLNNLLSEIQNSINTYGEDALIEVITRSMSANYTGILFDKLKDYPKIKKPQEKARAEPETDPNAGLDKIVLENDDGSNLEEVFADNAAHPYDDGWRTNDDGYWYRI